VGHSNWSFPKLPATAHSSFTSHLLLAIYGSLSLPFCSPLCLSCEEQDERSNTLEAPASSGGCSQASCLPPICPATNYETISQLPDTVQIEGGQKSVASWVRYKRLTTATGRRSEWYEPSLRIHPLRQQIDIFTPHSSYYHPENPPAQENPSGTATSWCGHCVRTAAQKA
jgi:hypothetical protein